MVAVSGCTGEIGSFSEDGAARYEIDGETVFVSAVDILYSAYSSTAQFVHQSPIMVVGTLAQTRDIAHEVPPDPDAEGSSPDDGADLLGAITVTVTSVVRGSAGPSVTIHYQSGKRDGSVPKRRIAYTYDGLRALQRPNGTYAAWTSSPGGRSGCSSHPDPRTTRCCDSGA